MRQTCAKRLNALDITSHTSIRGRQAYSRAEVAELVTASRLADSVVARPVEKAVSFGADRSVPRGAVYVDSEGSVLGGSVVEKGSRSACSGAAQLLLLPRARRSQLDREVPERRRDEKH